MKAPVLLRHVALLCAAGFITGCATPPPYSKPDNKAEAPAAWQTDTPWRLGTPSDGMAKGNWWEIFNDPELNALETKALANNQTLAAANARLAQARSQLAGAESARAPQVALSGRVARQQISANRPLTNYASPNFATTQNDFTVGLAASYEVDLAGRVQNLVDGASISAEQAAADLENTKLVLAADVAINYFSLRSLDADGEALAKSIELQQGALSLAKDRHDLGATSGLEVAQQQAQLDATLSQVDLLKRQRAVVEHAIATLVGTPAPLFRIAPGTLATQLPSIPLGVPSDALERRPDVASAERAMAAANAQIGVARAAYYPSISLNPAVGNDSNLIEKLFDAPSFLWSVGLSVTQTVFDGGRAKANEAFAKAGFDVTVANYRRTVLTAMQEAQDGISSVAALERAYAQTQVSAKSAGNLLRIATDRYEGGIASNLEVVAAQQAQINSERQLAQLGGQRLMASVALIKALGGGWQVQPPEQQAKATQ